MKKIKIIVLLFLLASVSLQAQSLRIEQKKLLENIENYKILDTRETKLYKNNHIKNAISFPVDLTYQNKQIDGKITDPKKMQILLRNLGLNINDAIVIYDNGTFFDAARLFWALEVYGFTNVKLLNFSYKQWSEENNPRDNKIKNIIKSKYISNINNKRLATKFTTQIATKNPNIEILDARIYDAYLGKKSLAKRFGHIKSAKYLSANHNINYLNKYQTLKNHEELKKVYKNFDKNKKIVVYCNIGRVASMNYFALRELGYDVSNYDAAWKEWGNDLSLPITNLSK